MPKHKHLFLILTTAVVAFFDQLSKFWVLDLLTTQPVFHIRPFLNFILVKNYGVSFGTFNNPAQNQMLLIMVSLAIIAMLLVWFIKSSSDKAFIPISMITGGAIGNIIDRIIHGAVIDFIDVKILNWHYPTFNVADAFICIGVMLLIIWPAPSNLKQKP